MEHTPDQPIQNNEISGVSLHVTETPMNPSHSHQFTFGSPADIQSNIEQSAEKSAISSNLSPAVSSYFMKKAKIEQIENEIEFLSNRIKHLQEVLKELKE